jgi:thioredoxin 1
MLLVGCASFNPLLPDGAKDGHGSYIIEYGADWCGACKVLEPQVKLLSEQFRIELVKVNIDYDPDYAKVYYIPLIPTVSIFSRGLLFYHGPWLGYDAMAQLMRAGE